MHNLQDWYPLITKYTPCSYIFPCDQSFIHAFLDEKEQVGTLCSMMRNLYPEIDDIFLHGKYFVRISCCSPKDILDQYDNETMTYMESIDKSIHILSMSSLEESISLLRSSERIRESLRCVSSTCIIWREWRYISLQCEYRCFIFENQLRGISQYMCMESISDPQYQYSIPWIREKIFSYWNNNIKEKMIHIGSYVMDISLSPDGSIFVVEINEWEGDTDSLMFSWKELCIEKDIEIRLYYEGYLDKWVSNV